MSQDITIPFPSDPEYGQTFVHDDRVYIYVGSWELGTSNPNRLRDRTSEYREPTFNATQAMTSKELGKIRAVSFGMGGYQDVQFGLSLTFESKGTVVGYFDGFRADRSSGAKWTEEDQVRYFGETMKRLRVLLKDAGVNSVEKLVGIPVELTFTGSMLKEFRILTEVL